MEKLIGIIIGLIILMVLLWKALYKTTEALNAWSEKEEQDFLDEYMDNPVNWTKENIKGWNKIKEV